MLGPQCTPTSYCLPSPTPHCTEISPHGSTLPTPSFQHAPFSPPPPPQHFLRPSTHGLMLPPPFPFYHAMTSCYMPSIHYSSHCVYPPPPPPVSDPRSPTSNPALGKDPAIKLAKLDIVSTNGGESVGNPGEDVCSKEAITLEYHSQPPPPLPIPFYPRSFFRKQRLVWLPRSCTGNGPSSKGIEDWKHSSIVSHTTTLSMSLEFDASQPEAGDRTTVMIRNIPSKLSREMLLNLLDKHCVEENEKAPSGGSSSSEYDFVYLPIDFRNKCNLGYAFVNFTTAEAACRLFRSLHHYKWNILRTKKISHICYARVQGKSALLRHFRNSYFECDTDEYLPAVLSPPRNGSTSCPHPSPVGRRAASLRQ